MEGAGRAGDEAVLDALEEILEPGEELRIYGSTNVAHGDDGPATEWELWEGTKARLDGWWSFVTRTWPRRILFFTVLLPVGLIAALDGIGGGLSDRLDRLVGGVTCRGPRGSQARQMQHALSPLGGRGSHLVVSDSRLLVVRVGIKILKGPPDVDVIWSAARTQVSSAERRPHGLLRRRVQLWFADGSTIVLALPFFDSSPKPSQVVDVLTQPAPSP